MGFSFKPLWHLLIDKGISKEQMRQDLNLSPATLAKMGKIGQEKKGQDQYVSMAVLDDICNYLKCPISEVIEHIPGRVKPRTRK